MAVGLFAGLVDPGVQVYNTAQDLVVLVLLEVDNQVVVDSRTKAGPGRADRTAEGAGPWMLRGVIHSPDGL